MHVTIIGAGLGGLCLANGLRNSGVEVEVLEAQDGINNVGQGYRINVDESGHAALRACLTDERFEAYERTPHRQSDMGVYLYLPALQLLSRHESPAAPGAIDPGTMRRMLANRRVGRIRFGRKVSSVAEIGATDLIVAADGVGSAFRQELVSHPGPQSLSGWSAIFGRSPLTEQHRAWTAPAILHTRFTGIFDGSVLLALCAYDPPVRGTVEPYVAWVLMGPTDELTAHGTSPEELFRFTEKRTADWDPRATALLRDAMVADTFHTPLRAMTDIPVRPGTPVAFLGDAIHAMSPAGGEGANTAFGDAALLVSQPNTCGTVTEAVANYHAEMRVRAGAALARSAAYGRVQEPSHA